MAFYVDCACQNHNIWRSFVGETEARAYYDARRCRSKILYRDSDDDKVFDTLASSEAQKGEGR